jgi:chemotaxis signal transduction protein
VIDLRARLGLPARPVAPSDHMIVAQTEGRLVALRVDRALDLVRLDAEPSAVGETEGARVARLTDGLAPLLDLRAVLAAEGPVAPPGTALDAAFGVAIGDRDGEGSS